MRVGVNIAAKIAIINQYQNYTREKTALVGKKLIECVNFVEQNLKQLEEKSEKA